MAFPGVDKRELRIHESIDELKNDLADHIAELSEASIKERGVFTVALSGGSLIALMGKLCEAPYKKTIDWGKWYIFWVDERVVAKNHIDSNYKLAKDGLLSKVPIIPSHIYSINDSVSADRAAEEYEFSIRQLVRTRIINVSHGNDCPRFDLVLLGMGKDGHVASLFPNHPIFYTETDEWVAFLTDSPESPPERITFTLPVVNSASNVAVVATGGGKAEAVQGAVGADVSESSPAGKVGPTKGRVVWFLDGDAASKLDGYRFL